MNWLLIGGAVYVIVVGGFGWSLMRAAARGDRMLAHEAVQLATKCNTCGVEKTLVLTRHLAEVLTEEVEANGPLLCPDCHVGSTSLVGRPS